MTEFEVSTMSCGGCAKRISAAIAQADPQAQVTVDLASKRVQVHSALPAEQLAQAMGDAGYPATQVQAAAAAKPASKSCCCG